MLYTDIPTLNELKALINARADACVSIYLPTTPLTQETGADRIALGNLTKAALAQLVDVGFDKRRLAALEEHLVDLADDDDFWKYQARSLAVLATPEGLQTFRLPNRLGEFVEVADRFHIKPLLRAITFPHEALVLAASQAGVRLVTVSHDLPAAEVKVHGMPEGAADAVGRASVRDRSPSRRLHGSEGQKVLLRAYARQIDGALRGILAGRELPLILAAVEPLASIVRSVITYPGLVAETIDQSPERLPDHELAALARPILDRVYADQVAAARALFDERVAAGRATTELSDIARAATFGAVELLMVDIDVELHGTIGDDGAVTLVEAADAVTYGILDEIAGRALLAGARVLAVRAGDLPSASPVAAILRYPV
jgi:hypothetical protein